jgi:uncharacterized membrane protein
MLRSFLIGLVAGQRGITPLATVGLATYRGEVDDDLPLQKLFHKPLVTAGAITLALAEMGGDKMKSAPDRTVPIGLAVRAITSAYAGAALAPRDQRVAGAAVAISSALISSYIGLRLRQAAMDRVGQTASGLAEDAVVFAAGLAITNPELTGTRALIGQA